jgi:hypothetical protein
LGSKNAQTHGAYSDELRADDDLDKRIEDLGRRIQQLSNYIDGQPGLEPDLLKLHGELTSRLGRLKSQRHQLDGGGDEMMKAIHEALEILEKNWGVAILA